MRDECEMIGMPDVQFLAGEIWAGGYLSIAEAEVDGWLVTKHAETRQRVDALLTDWRILRNHKTREESK